MPCIFTSYFSKSPLYRDKKSKYRLRGLYSRIYCLYIIYIIYMLHYTQNIYNMYQSGFWANNSVSYLLLDPLLPEIHWYKAASTPIFFGFGEKIPWAKAVLLAIFSFGWKKPQFRGCMLILCPPKPHVYNTYKNQWGGGREGGTVPHTCTGSSYLHRFLSQLCKKLHGFLNN